MCNTLDTYGAPGTKLDIDIEELGRIGKMRMNQEYKKPTQADVLKLTPLICEIIERAKALTSQEMNVLCRKYKFNGKRPFLFQTYLLMLESSSSSLTRAPNSDAIVRQSLQIKAVKSWSGICSVTIFTSPYPEYTHNGEKHVQNFSCEHKCSFCPSEPGMPKSYLTNEPAVLRAAKNKFDCVAQVHDRIHTLYIMGHSVNKIELNVLGGTWSSYPKEYREEFIRDAIYALNVFWDKDEPRRQRLSLSEEKKINETARCRLVLLAIELRPDSITPEEIRHLRYLAVTRVQMGIQHLDDEVLKKNNRRCTTKQTVMAIQLLKMSNFKIDAHYMPNLPFSNVELDRQMLLVYMDQSNDQ